MGLRWRPVRSAVRPGLDVTTCIVAILLLTNLVASIDVIVDYVIHDVSEVAMPDDVNVTVTTELNTTATLRLSRVKHIDLDIPLYTLTNDADGRLIHRREKLASKKATHALYQDVATDAIFQLTKQDGKKDKKNRFKLKGEFTMAGSKYSLHPEEKNKRNFKTTAATTATTSATPSATPSNSTPFDDFSYRLEPQKSYQRQRNDYRTAPPEKTPSARNPKLSDPPREPRMKSEKSKIPEDLFSQLKTKMDPLGDIGLVTPQTQTPLESNASADWPKTQAELLRRRRSSTTYFVDVAAVIDYTAYQRFLAAAYSVRITALQNILEYYAFVFNGVDLRYQSINTNYAIHVNVNKVFVMETSGTSPFSDTRHTATSIDSDLALETFKSFVAYRGGDLMSTYDHAMLFTGYDLTSVGYTFFQSVSHDTIGIAYTSTLCKTDGSSVSIIEDLGGYRCINTAAHELAHSLSAQHDSEGNSCSFSQQYIMAASNAQLTPTTQYNPWQFSRCSVGYFTSYIQTLMLSSRGQTCLTGRLPIDNSIPDVSGRLLGQQYSPDQQCQLIYGSRSYYCRGLGNKFETICTSMYCLDPKDKDMCYKVSAMAGTTCGSGKVCRSGHCVVDQRAPAVDEICIHGEQSGVIYQNMACPALIRSSPGYCYNDELRSQCCKSCQTVYQPIRNCEYGDPSTRCVSIFCYDYANISECCRTCHVGQPIVTQKATTKITAGPVPITNRTAPPTVQDDCRNRVPSCRWQMDKTGSKCYDLTFQMNCCQSCKQYYSNIPGCEYGDQRPEMCFKTSLCHTNAKWCCQTCGINSSPISGGLSGLNSILAVAVVCFQRLL